jgi:hypothetical protein
MATGKKAASDAGRILSDPKSTKRRRRLPRLTLRKDAARRREKEKSKTITVCWSVHRLS